MKKMMMIAIMLFWGSVCCAEPWVFGKWYDLTKEEVIEALDDGSPEAVAVAYMMAFHAGDEDAVLALCDERFRTRLESRNRVIFKKVLEKAKHWDLEKKFEGMRTNSEDIVRISVEYFNSARDLVASKPIELILVDGQYKVTN
jgi:hypothetical protein